MIWDALTVEPGIYHDGWFGIRIEDDFLINNDGHEFLTADLPRNLDWAMITLDDYTPTSVIEIKNNEGDSSFLPYPVGFVEVLVLFAIIVAVKRDDFE